RICETPKPWPAWTDGRVLFSSCLASFAPPSSLGGVAARWVGGQPSPDKIDLRAQKSVSVCAAPDMDIEGASFETRRKVMTEKREVFGGEGKAGRARLGAGGRQL